ncbi:unnamed protein product, partial [Ectocarpus sp. 6 AP-2014]
HDQPDEGDTHRQPAATTIRTYPDLEHAANMAMRGLGKKTPAQPTAVTTLTALAYIPHTQRVKERRSNRRPARPPTKQVPLRTTSLVSAAVPWVSPTGPTSVPPAPLSPSSGPPARLARPARCAAF